jgi:hypothetical protein
MFTTLRSIRPQIRTVSFLMDLGRRRKRNQFSALLGVLALTLCGASCVGWSQSKAATTTTITVTSAGSAVTTVSAGAVVTLTASVKAGSAEVTIGQVNFCDASAKYCTDIHLLGTSQLTSAGTATLKFRLGIGSHSYKAVFLGTNTYAGSASGKSALAVTGTSGPIATTTTTAESGSWGNYALTATVTEVGGAASPSGTVSFVDTSYGDTVVATAQLNSGTPGLSWENSQTQSSGFGTESVASADFNRDGIPDLAVIGFRDNSLRIFLGNGDGTFTADSSSMTVNSPGSIAVADFNEDGIPDLAITDYTSPGGVTVLLGKGDGTFSAASSALAAPDSADSITVADFNGDGIPDMAVSTPFSGTISVFLGNGDGTFAASQTTLSNSGCVSDIASGDFNGDGKPDLVVTGNCEYDQGNSVIILLGNGDGTFTNGAMPQTGLDVGAVTVADFNGDGKMDLAVANSDGNATLTILLGNGDGTFSIANIGPVIPAHGASIATGDFNGDGIMDIAVPNVYSNTVVIYAGKGDGTFTPAAYAPATGSDPVSITTADFNQDGRTDIATANYFDSTVSVLLATATITTTPTSGLLAAPGQHLVEASYAGNYKSSVSGTVLLWGEPPTTVTTLSLTSGGIAVTTVASGTPVTLAASVSSGSNPLASGQVNFCDATATDCLDMHLVGQAQLTSNGTASLKFIPGPGQHSYKAVLVENGYASPSSSAAVALTVNASAPVISPTTTTIAQSGTIGDYSLTATVAGSGSTAALTGSVSFLDTSYSNTSLATATVGASTPGLDWNLLSTTPFTGLAGSVAGDFNGDGIPDLVELNSDSMTITVLLGVGDGTFKSIAGPAITTYPTAIIAGDFNHDGKIDFALTSSAGAYNSPNILTIFLGNGDGTFTAGYTATDVGSVFAAADFNSDGKLDLLANQGTTSTVVLLGNGDGTFATGTTIGAFQTLTVDDLNGDSIPDLVVSFIISTNSVYSTITEVYLGNGDGSYRAGPALPVSEEFNYIAAGDFNGDGIPDLAGISNFGASPVVFLGDGDGSFTVATSVPDASNDSEPSSIALADLNGDGKLDILVTNGNSYSNSYNPDFMVWLGNGDGTFTSVAANTSLGSTAYAIPADFSGNGVSELAMEGGGNLVILEPVPTVTATATANGVAPTGPAPHLVAASYPGDKNYAASTSGTTPLSVQAATPVIGPASGAIASAQYITITDSTPGVTIYYYVYGAIGTNGYVPYTAPIPLEGSGTINIQAYATETGYQQSGSASAVYTLNFSTPAATPVISLASDLYPSAQTVTISDATPGAQIYYSTNGTYPYTYSNLYSGAITASTSEIVTAVALAPGYSASGDASAQYDIASSSSRFIYTVAGNQTPGYVGDGGPATYAELNGPQGVAVDSAGNIYMTDSGDNVVRKVAAKTGIITTIAGTGVAGHTGDSGPAAGAELWAPSALAVDAAGDLFIGETGDTVVRRIDGKTGTITTFAGDASGTGSLGGPATSFQLYSLNGLACDHLGNLFIAEFGDVVEVNASTGNISEIAGYSTDAGFSYLVSIAVDSGENVYVSDSSYNVVRRINPQGVVSIFAGSLYGGYGGDGGPATSAHLDNPAGLAVDSAGNVYIADQFDEAIREVNTSGIINTIAGVLSVTNTIGGDGSPATDVGIFFPQAIAADAAGDIYLADQYYYRIRKITAPTTPPSAAAAAPVLSLASGTYSSAQTLTMTDATPGAEIYVSLNGSAPTTTSQGYHGPIAITGTVTVQAIALAPGYLASAPVSATYTFTAPPTAVITTVAGNGQSALSAGSGPALDVGIGQPEAIALDGSGDFYIADSYNNVVWKVTASTGDISIVAGTGTSGDGAVGGQATATALNTPDGLAVDKAGNLYIADTFNLRVLMVDAKTGVVSAFAGPGKPDNLGDGGPATSAFLAPQGMAFDSAGNLYVADSNNNRIRMIAAKTGIITTVAGGGTASNLGDGGPAIGAWLSGPSDVTLDAAGNLYISDSYNGRIRKVDASTGVITTIAGNGTLGDTGDGGPATSAEIYVTAGIAVNNAGDVYLSNRLDTVRKVDAATGTINTIAGNGYFGFSGDGGAASVAELYEPLGMALDAKGNIYFTDDANGRVREVIFTASAVAPTLTLTPSASSITSMQALTVTVAVSGGSGNPTPTGSVTLSGGGYNSAAATLSNGGVALVIPAGSLALGSDTLKVTYTPDIASVGSYATATQSTTVTVTVPIGSATATVTATPSAAIITNDQSVTVSIAVAGGSGQPTPTGTITLTSGSYSAQQTLASGAASFDIAAGTLSSGANTLAASYAGDATYAIATGTTVVTVSAVTMTVSAPSPVSPGSSASTTVTLTAGSSYSGTLNLKCALTASPANAQSPPTCTLNPASVTVSVGGNSATKLTIDTTAASSSALARPVRKNLWGFGGGGAVLAIVLFFGLPSRRRRWMPMLVLLWLAAAAGTIGCGGGGSGGTGQTNPPTPATTAGSYTFTLTGTDSANANITVSANITLTVQ